MQQPKIRLNELWHEIINHNFHFFLVGSINYLTIITQLSLKILAQIFETQLIILNSDKLKEIQNYHSILLNMIKF